MRSNLTSGRAERQCRRADGEAVKIHNRRPRFGDPVILDGNRFSVVATVCAPWRGYFVCPAGAADADHDRFVAQAEWNARAWDTQRQWWEAA